MRVLQGAQPGITATVTGVWKTVLTLFTGVLVVHPNFPSHIIFSFCLHYWKQFQKPRALEMRWKGHCWLCTVGVFLTTSVSVFPAILRTDGGWYLILKRCSMTMPCCHLLIWSIPGNRERFLCRSGQGHFYLYSAGYDLS